MARGELKRKGELEFLQPLSISARICVGTLCLVCLCLLEPQDTFVASGEFSNQLLRMPMPLLLLGAALSSFCLFRLLKLNPESSKEQRGKAFWLSSASYLIASAVFCSLQREGLAGVTQDWELNLFKTSILLLPVLIGCLTVNQHQIKLIGATIISFYSINFLLKLNETIRTPLHIHQLEANLITLSDTVAMGLVLFLSLSMVRSIQNRIDDNDEAHSQQAESYAELELNFLQTLNAQHLEKTLPAIFHRLTNLFTVVQASTASLRTTLDSQTVSSSIEARQDGLLRGSLNDLELASKNGIGILRSLSTTEELNSETEESINLHFLLEENFELLQTMVGEGVSLQLRSGRQAIEVSACSGALALAIRACVHQFSELLEGKGELRLTLDNGKLSADERKADLLFNIQLNQGQIEAFHTKTVSSAEWQAMYRLITLSGGQAETRVDQRIGLSLKLTWELAANSQILSVSSSKKVVVLAEDNHLVRRATRRLLGQLNLEIHEASTGQEAIEIIDRLKQVDLLISDVLMPKMSGLEVLHLLRERGDQLPVILLSALSKTQAEKDALEATPQTESKAHRQNYSYLQKPVEAVQLLSLAESFLVKEGQKHSEPDSILTSEHLSNSSKLENSA